MRALLLLFLLLPIIVAANVPQNKKSKDPIVQIRPSSDLTIVTQKIEFEGFPEAFNPCILKTDFGVLLSFRYNPYPEKEWISQVGVVLLNDYFEPTCEPKLLELRSTLIHPPYYEDCRLFSFAGKTYILFSDIPDLNVPPNPDKRPYSQFKQDMQLVELRFENNRFVVGKPLRLKLEKRQWREKNWSPFESNGELFFSYYPEPHRILKPNLITGECKRVYNTRWKIDWKWGKLRETSPALLVDGEYLAFFHSCIRLWKAKKINLELSERQG